MKARNPQLPVFIYALCEPDTGEERYVGATTDLKRRYSHHLTEARHYSFSPKSEWIVSLLLAGKKPIQKVLATCPASARDTVEASYAYQLFQRGSRLLNVFTCLHGACRYRQQALEAG